MVAGTEEASAAPRRAAREARRAAREARRATLPQRWATLRSGVSPRCCAGAQVLAMLRENGLNIVSTGGETADLGDLVRTVVVDSTVVTRMRRADVISNDRIAPGDVIVGMASAGRASYEAEYNGGMGSNGAAAPLPLLRFGTRSAHAPPPLPRRQVSRARGTTCSAPRWPIDTPSRSTRRSTGRWSTPARTG